MLKKTIAIKDDNTGFAGLGIKDSILKVIKELGLETPTPIQRQAIPAALDGQDIVGIAQTGTGKTFAFGIPLLQRLALVKGRGLALLPTRELAGQVEDSLRSLGDPLGLRTVSLIGGEAIGRQLFALRKRPHVIVATPGRLIDHLKRQSVKLDDVSVLILDEADMMFDMGFAPQIEEVLKRVPAARQTLLFSATMPVAVMKLAEKYLRTPIRVEVAPAGTTVELVDQEIYLLSRDDRWEETVKLVKEYKESVLIFVRTKHGASKLAKKLQISGFKAAEIHSNLSFSQRQASLVGFKSGQHRILVATDVAARGLDINGIELVLNFDLPDNSEDYVHRIGRTARAGKRGKAISFAAPDQYREIQKIERLIRQNLPVKKIGSPSSARSFRHGQEKTTVVISRKPMPRTAKKFVQKDRKPRVEFSSARPVRSARPVQTERYSSLGFRKRSEKVDILATPDYLQPSGNRRPQSSGHNFPVPPIINPEFDGGNRFSFRQKMHRLKEEAKGRPVSSRPRPEASKPRTTDRPEYSHPRQVGLRASGYKVFKGGEEERNTKAATSLRRPARTKTFRPRSK